MASIGEAVELIRKSKHTCAFTGAGISVESGIPPFRGKDGLWSKVDPIFLDINYFHSNPDKSWQLIKDIFYKFFSGAEPNPAHFGLAALEKKGYIKAVITQNIDNLHQLAGSRNVIEFHGTSQYLICTNCRRRFKFTPVMLDNLPPECQDCGGVLKPDFVFFGEPIPPAAHSLSLKEVDDADVFLLVGTTGKIQPASMIPIIAKEKGAKIVEVNVEESNYTHTITDIFFKGKAAEIVSRLSNLIIG